MALLNTNYPIWFVTSGSEKHIGYNHEIATWIAKNHPRIEVNVYEFTRYDKKFERLRTSEWLQIALKLNKVSATSKAKLTKNFETRKRQ